MSSDSIAGFWEPHSSSVDFCEPNYFLSPYIAEFHNSWSSLLISAIATLGLIYGNPTGEMRFSLMFGILIFIGIGSFALHATLNWFPQSSDEVPMLWETLAIVYCLIETKTPKEKKNHSLPLIVSSVAVIQTIVYYRFQSFYAIFIVSYSLYTIVIAGWTFQMARARYILDKNALGPKLWISSCVSYIFIASILWVYEMHHCEQLLPYFIASPLGGMTFHVVWHIGAAMGTYFIILFLISERLYALGRVAKLEWVAGIVPVCNKGDDSTTATIKKRTQ
jgi:dihydroceramidase